MLRNRDFLLVALFALALAYANLVGPQRLRQQLYPKGEFALARWLPQEWRAAPTPIPVAKPKPPVIVDNVALRDAPNDGAQRRKRMPLPRGMERRMRPKPLVDGAL